MGTAREETLRRLYEAFNGRGIEAVLSAMASDVDWPNGWEGGRLVGHAEVRRYWERVWARLRPTVDPTSFREAADGRVEVVVRQVVRDLSGAVLTRDEVRHSFQFVDDRVRRMDVVRASPAADPRPHTTPP